MILGATAVAFFGALLLHLLKVPGFTDLVAVPISVLVVACAFGVLARILPWLRRGMVKIVPPWVPQRELVVWLSGAAELAALIGLLIPATRVVAAIALGVFFVAVFPANVHHARLRERRGANFLALVIPRTLEQIFFIAMCVWVVVLST